MTSDPESVGETAASKPRLTLTAPLRIPAFRRYWFALVVSFTGDQLTFIALPWLVLKLTGDPLLMGTIMAAGAIPRAVFMLVGGVFTDRYSPRRVMLYSNLVRMALVAALAVLTFSGDITVWMIYAISVGFGVADAFMFPAMSAYLPRLLATEELGPGNSLTQGTAQVTTVVGPLVGGGLIAMFGGSTDQGIADGFGLAVVFALDALTFLVPVVVFTTLQDRFSPVVERVEQVWRSMIEGLRWTLNDMPLRTLTILFAGIAMIARGPMMVGIPAFADAYLPQGAAGFGIILAAFGVGAIVGTLVAGSTRHPPPHRIGSILLVDFAVLGVVFVLMTMTTSVVLISAAFFVGAMLDGYVIIIVITWVQRRVPPERMGRTMSVLMFFNVGLVPVALAVAGWAASVSLLGMIGVGGALLIATSAVGGTMRSVRRLGHE